MRPFFPEDFNCAADYFHSGAERGRETREQHHHIMALLVLRQQNRPPGSWFLALDLDGVLFGMISTSACVV